jgi:benzoylformate decarboxylase
MIKKVSEVFRDILLEHGVEYVYGIPGATELWFMDILEKTPEIQYILGLNESVCVAMAEAYARASGKPAVLNLHTGPGLAASMAMLTNCQNGNVPIVATVGQNDSRFLVNEPQLAGDLAGMGDSVAKYSVEVNRAEDFAVILQRAFKVAMTPPMGPVIVSIPGNLLRESVDYVPWNAPDPSVRSRGDQSLIRQAADLIKQCKNPIMLVQEGVAISGAVPEVTELATLAGAGVYQIWMGDVNFPMQHVLNCGDLMSTSEEAQNIFAKSDLLIAVGCKVFNDAFYSGRKIIHDDMKIIHIHEDAWEIGKNFSTDVGIAGDPKTIVSELNELLKDDVVLKKNAEARIEKYTSAFNAKKEKLNEKIENEKDYNPIAISHLMNTLKQVLPDDVMLLDDCWSSSGLLRSILDIKPGHFCRPRNGGSIGFGISGVMGLKQAVPEKKAVAVCGDGSAVWAIQALWTAAHYNIPVTWIITNNATYRQVKNVRKAIMGDYPLNEPHLGMEIGDPVIDFASCAKSMGVEACAVKDPKELKAALQNAIASDKPYLVEVYVENPPK